MMNLEPSRDFAFIPIDELLGMYKVASKGFERNYLLGAITARIVLLAQENVSDASELIKKINITSAT